MTGPTTPGAHTAPPSDAPPVPVAPVPPLPPVPVAIGGALQSPAESQHTLFVQTKPEAQSPWSQTQPFDPMTQNGVPALPPVPVAFAVPPVPVEFAVPPPPFALPLPPVPPLPLAPLSLESPQPM